MNAAVFQSARANGCTPREAEVLATYVESDSLKMTARAMGISTQTVKNHLVRVHRRFGVRHTAAVIAKLS